jgi:hypothetical protein
MSELSEKLEVRALEAGAARCSLAQLRIRRGTVQAPARLEAGAIVEFADPMDGRTEKWRVEGKERGQVYLVRARELEEAPRVH